MPACGIGRTMRLICNSHVERWQAGQSANIASISSLLMTRCPPLQFASTAARADEGGVSFWLPGIYSSLAAVPPSPCFSTPSSFYSYSGDAGGDRNFDIGGLVASNVRADFRGILLAPQWVPETPVATVFMWFFRNAPV